MSMYTAYDVAHHILQIRNYVSVPVLGFAELPKDVLSALLWLSAEWRNVDEMENLIKMGADVYEMHQGFTVLDNIIQGHDGNWRVMTETNVKQVEDSVKMISSYGVTGKDLTKPWILSNCKDIIENSEYLCNFFSKQKMT